MSELVFTYGTLRSGQRNHFMMCGQEPIATAFIHARNVGHLTDIPLVVPDPESIISGEIYQVSPEHLQRLDRFEGIDVGMYERVLVQTTEGQPVWSYFPTESLLARAHGESLSQ